MSKTHLIRSQFIDYFLVTIVLILEVTVFFDDIEFSIPQLENLVQFIILSILFLKRKKSIDKIFILLVLLVKILILIQGYFFGFSLITLFTYPAFVFLTPYFLYKITWPRIFEYLVNVIYYTAIISTLLWLAQNLFNPFNYYLENLFYSDNILTQGLIAPYQTDRISLAFIYTYPAYSINIFGIEVFRNYGLYHEPGAFAYFLIIAIGTNYIIQKNFFNKKNIIMALVLLTTFSTTGYLAFFLLVLTPVFSSEVNPRIKVLAIPLFLIISAIAYTQLDFMHDKIETQFESEIDNDRIFERTGGRIWRIRGAINLLSTSPLFGRGIALAARDFELGSRYYFTGAGIWRTLSNFGLLFAPLLYYFYYKGIRRLCIANNFNTSFAIFFFVAIALSATSQRFFMDNITLLFFVNGISVYCNKHKQQVSIN